jgi:PAS domain S-box-containing protein
MLLLLTSWLHRRRPNEKLPLTRAVLETRVSQRTAELVAANAFVKQEIAERKLAQEALASSEERLRVLIEGVKDYAIFMLDCSGRIVSWNEGAKRIKGYSQEEIIGKHFSCFYPAEEVRQGKAARALRTALSAGRYEEEGWRIRKDGTRFWANVVITALRDEADKLRGFSKVTRDITDRKRAEETRNQLLQKLVTAEEDERRRFSRELHDHMGQSLAALMLGLNSLGEAAQFEPAAKGRLQKLREITSQLARDVHTLARDLRPPALDDFGLPAALSNYLEEWAERSQIAADFHSNGLLKRRLPAHIETAVYRIVQEALTNVVKYAQARKVSVIVEHRSNRVLAIVEDDGCGFDIEAVSWLPVKERRLGLLGMQERATLAGGKLNIESRPGAGTTVLVCIPIGESAKENTIREAKQFYSSAR